MNAIFLVHEKVLTNIVIRFAMKSLCYIEKNLWFGLL
jgi:hypothetical protein